MPELALIAYLLYLVVAFGWRTWRQIRATGSAGFHGISGTPRTAEWWGGVLFVVALAAGVAAPVLQLTGVVSPISVLTGDTIAIGGAVVAGLGIVLTVLAQSAMGTAWRIGVDEQDRTTLVTGGLFALVRNPIFTAMIMAAIGLALIAPNVVAVLAVVVLIGAIELQIRSAEEPYLLVVHGDDYRRYASVVGRLVPGVGRLDRRGDRG